MSVDRLTADDQVMLWPDPMWPQDIGAVAVLDGSRLLDPDGRLRLEVVQQAIAGRLHRAPRFRQLLCVPPRGLGAPLWVDDPAFDLAEHVRVAPLPPPGDDASLLHTVAQLRRHRLDRSRPLWEMWFLPGLPNSRLGLFIRMHHVVADGIAGVATLSAFLEPTADAGTPSAPPWLSRPAPTSGELLVDNARRHAGRLRGVLAGLAHPGAVLGPLRVMWPALREFLPRDGAPVTSLDRMVSADRTLAVVRAGMDEVGQIAQAHGATVNDVLLAATAGGLRALLSGRGELTDDLVVRADVPVTLRPVRQRASARGNLIAQMVVPLPVGMSDPGRRLERITAETTVRKARRRPSLGALLRSRITRRAVLLLLSRYPVNVATADVPGPGEPVFLAGAQVLEVFPLLNLIGNQTLAVGALSYAGRFSVMAVADRDTVPDLDTFAAGAQAELRALAATAAPVAAGGSAATD
jgi:diacylglycerol O-acyltransferase / wax synthase